MGIAFLTMVIPSLITVAVIALVIFLIVRRVRKKKTEGYREYLDFYGTNGSKEPYREYLDFSTTNKCKSCP